MHGGPSARMFLREAELALLNAPFGGGWAHALDLFARATGSQGSNLISLGGPVPSLNILTGYDAASFAETFADPELWSVGNWRVGTATAPFAVQHDLHYDAYRALHRTSRYDEVVDAMGMPFGCQTIFAQDETGFLGLALIRTRKDGRCTPDMVAMFERLSRVTARAIKVEATLSGDGAALALAEMEQVGKAIILVNRHGWRCAMSPAAEQLLLCGQPIQSARERLRLSDPADNYRFQQLLSYFLATPAVAAFGAGISSQGWRIELTHLPLPPGELRFEASLAIVLTPEQSEERAP